MGESWVLAFRYPSMDAAKPAWERVRDAILYENLDASVYRSLINGIANVAVVGGGSLDETQRERFVGLCAGGELTDIPDAVAAYLVERRKESGIPGAFWERRSGEM